MNLPSIYYPGIRPWQKTYLEDAPDPSTAEAKYDLIGHKHYRAQPVEPLFMFDPHVQPKGDPGLNESWTKRGIYPALRYATTTR